MNYVLQVVYAIINIGSYALDYFIYQGFVKDYHHTEYIQVSEYTDLAEAVIAFLLLILGLFVEMGKITTDAHKKTWVLILTIIDNLMIIEASIRTGCMTIVSIHIHPGKIDFMGLFTLMIIMYFLLKMTTMMQLIAGLSERIESYKPPVMFSFAPCQMVNQQEEPKRAAVPMFVAPDYFIHE